MRVLSEMNPLESVVTDAGEGGVRYYLSEGPQGRGSCQRIVVSMEHGPMSMIPFAVCIAHDNTVNLVNLTRCSEVQMKDKLPSESDIHVVPAGTLPGPGNPGYQPD